MGIKLNSEQLNAINKYRKANKLGNNVSNDQILQRMIKSGKVPSCFSSLVQSGNTQNKKSIWGDKQKSELNSLGYVNNKGAGKKIKGANGKIYTIVGQAKHGRKIVKDSSGQLQVLSGDNKLLNKTYVMKTNKTNTNTVSKTRSNRTKKNTIAVLHNNMVKAQRSFEKQMAEDGWAGDLADGISVLWGSDNRAGKVEKDLKSYKQNLTKLQQAATKGDIEFKTQFKKMFGVNYNENAINEYIRKPTEENYQKAFGTKNNIRERVENYNESQRQGAAAVKTGATIAAGVAIGVATGGTGIAALGAAAAATTASSAVINTSDRLSSDSGLKDGEMGQIMKDAVWDGASTLAGGAVGKIASTAIKGVTTGAKIARAAVNTAGDTAMGAAQEYAETGKVTAQGVISNAALSGVGGAAVDGVLEKVAKKITRTKHSTNVHVQPEQLYNEAGEPIAGGLFDKSNSSSSFIKSLFRSTETSAPLSEAQIRKKVQKNINITKSNDPGTASISHKLKQSMTPYKESVIQLNENIDLKNISTYIAPGEVCSVGVGQKQKLYVNDNGHAVEIKVSKEKFEELFPKTGFAMAEQKGLNNCWLVSRLNSMTESSTGKAKIYSMFEELPNGDIQITLNDSDPIIFPKGKPVSIEAAQLGEGASPGLEMVLQSVLVRTLKGAERKVTNITDLNLEMLKESTDNMNSDFAATKYLFGNNISIKRIGTPMTNMPKSDPELQIKYEQELEDALNSFQNGNDMGTAIWAMHSRSIVGYNPQTKMVTYHDPYYGGVDITCTLDEFKHFNPSLNIAKSKNKPIDTNSSSQNSDKTDAAGIPKRPAKLADSPDIVIASTKPKAQTSNFISSTNIVRDSYREIAKTADDKSIYAMISGNDIIINKNGKQHNFSLDEIKESGSVTIKESSTETYITLNVDKFGRVSVTHTKNPPETSTNTSTNIQNDGPNFTSQNLDKNNTTGIPKRPAKLAIPAGYKEHGTILGKRAIIGPDYIVMYESNGKWKRLN